MLANDLVLSEPIICFSYYFKKNHLTYYQKLDAVRTDGDFQGSIMFYLTAIRDSSIDAYKRLKDIKALEFTLRNSIMHHKKITTAAGQLRLRALSIIFGSPVISIGELKNQLDISYNTASQGITDFERLGILSENTHQKRGKLFTCKPYFEILEREY
jgi:Fic family protein